MVNIGKAARMFRERLGITQKEMAAKLRFSNVYLCNLENDKEHPTKNVLEKFRDTFGVDLYVVAWCSLGNAKNIPVHMREIAKRLTIAWSDYIDEVVEEYKQPA